MHPSEKHAISGCVVTGMDLGSVVRELSGARGTLQGGERSEAEERACIVIVVGESS